MTCLVEVFLCLCPVQILNSLQCDSVLLSFTELHLFLVPPGGFDLLRSCSAADSVLDELSSFRVRPLWSRCGAAAGRRRVSTWGGVSVVSLWERAFHDPSDNPWTRLTSEPSLALKDTDLCSAGSKEKKKGNIRATLIKMFQLDGGAKPRSLFFFFLSSVVSFFFF